MRSQKVLPDKETGMEGIRLPDAITQATKCHVNNGKGGSGAPTAPDWASAIVRRPRGGAREAR